MLNRAFDSRRWVYVVLILVLTADAVFYFGWIRDPAFAGDADPAQIATLEEDVRVLRRKAERLRTFDAGVPQMSRRARSFMRERLLGDTDGYRVLAQDLNNAARGAGVNLVRFSPSEQSDQDRPNLRRITVSVDIEGSFAGLLRFMDRLERNPQLYLLTEFSLVDAKGGQVQVQVETITYFRREQG